MGTRILNWHFNGNPDMQVYYIEQDMEPRGIRIHSKTPPSGGDCKVDILDDGVSILNDYAKLMAGDTLETDAEDYPAATAVIAAGSVVTCQMVATNGANSVSIQLELETSTEEDEVIE